MKYLFDTDHATFLQRRSGPEHARLSGRIALHPRTDFALAIVGFHEQVLGAHSHVSRAKSEGEIIRGYAILEELLALYQTAAVLPFDAAAVITFNQLRAQRIRIATMDLRIASIAVSQGLVLLTRNSVDFSKVPGLVIEDWTV